MRIKRNRISFFRERDEEAPPQEFKAGRIKKIESEKRIFKPIIIASSVAVVVVVAILVLTKYYKEPQIFTPSKIPVISEIEKKAIPTGETGNKHLQRGKDSYFKGYFNHAIAEFKEVVESDSTDEEKAIALTYIGIIYDDRGDYNKAIEYYTRALKYDDKNPIVYRNMAIAYRHKRDLDMAGQIIRKGLDVDPEDINNQILAGNIYFEQGRYREAIHQYEKAIELDPNNARALYNLALSLQKRGDEVASIEYLKRSGAIDKIGEVAYLAYSRLGVIYTERNDYDSALKYLKMAISINPKDAIDRYNLGIAYLKQGQRDKALNELHKAEELAREDVDLLENLGDAFFSLKEYDKSVDTYNKMLSMGKRNVKILARIAEVYYEKGDLENSYEFYKKITTYEPASENARVAYINMGNILDDVGRFDDAIQTYQKALAIDNRDDSVLYNLGISYKNAEKWDLAIESWRNASNINPDKPDPLLAIARYYYENNYFDLAMDEYQRILRRWPNIQEGHFNLATIYYKKNLLDYSKEEYNRVIEINKKNDLARKAYINLGIITSKTDTDSLEAIQNARAYIQRALLLKPGDGEALYSLGTIYIKEEMLDKAIDTFYQAIRSTRDSKLIADAYNQIGKCYYKKGQYREALQSFTRGIEEEPTFEEIRMNRRVAMQAYEDELSKKISR
ncbi:MAG: tetratricopeptide repeat protein [Spirochaetota bacterium]|nr:tetratricopeptide repeat protein [Spirochaetota bacterium]